jgi:hypothetical protein
VSVREEGRCECEVMSGVPTGLLCCEPPPPALQPHDAPHGSEANWGVYWMAGFQPLSLGLGGASCI